MLEKLHLKNVGPAPELEMEFAPRLNIITGDNGLGKSFILDVAWWALTGTLSSKVDGGYVALPLPGVKSPPEIRWRSLHPTLNNPFAEISNKAIFDFVKHQWIENGTVTRTLNFLMIHSRMDGHYSVYDSYRTKPFSHGISVFNLKQVWDGLTQGVSIVCEGLIRDWASWQRENGNVFHQLKMALEIMSPNQDEKLELGELTRVMDDARDMPTLKMAYGQEIPIIQASAGIKRIISLVYMLVWAWKEHLIAAKLTQQLPTKEIVLLIDELEEHLHPRWQRVILNSILEVAKTIMGTSEVQIQIIATTHSPLVMASLEPLFDPKKDAWFDLNLVKGEVTLEKMQWRKQGSAEAWLTSEAFDLDSTGSLENARVKNLAAKALNNPKLSKKKFLELDTELRNVLPEMDEFWIRWRFIGEKKGYL
jgi:hypothetical protein